jgi:hypothetical protein
MKKCALAALIAATMALAACGSSDKKDDTSGGGDTTAASGGSNQALSYSDFVAKANELCKSVNDQSDTVSAGLTGEAANDAPILEKLIPILKDGTAKLDTLTPPAELGDAWNAFKADAEAQLPLTDAALAAAKSGDDASYKQAIAQLQTAGEKTNTDAAATGAAECAK